LLERFYQLENVLFAVLSNGELWARPASGSRWQHVLPDIERIKAVAGSKG
jgi:hypothetical protein